MLIKKIYCIWKIETPPTAMDDDELPAESATTISRSLLILLFTNTQYFCNKNAMSVTKTKTFQQMVVNIMQLLIFCYSRKYTYWSINFIKWKTIFSDALPSSTIRKWGQFFFLCEWVCSSKSKRQIVLENTYLLIFNN